MARGVGALQDFGFFPVSAASMRIVRRPNGAGKGPFVSSRARIVESRARQKKCVTSAALASLLSPFLMVSGIINGMEVKIDKAGRIVVPKPLRQRLGFKPGTELEAIER